MLTLQAIRIFVEVSHRKSFSAAGRHLGLSPGAVSRQIAALESELQVQLVNRSSRSLSLTEAGEIVRRSLQTVVDDVRSVEQLASELQKVPHGILRVHSRVTFGLHCVVPVLPEFVRRYPEIRLEFRLSDEEVNLLEDHVEVDIRVGGPADSTDMVRKIAPSHPVLCAAPAYIGRHGAPARPDELSRHNCLSYLRREGPVFWNFTDGDGVVERVSVAGSIQSNSGEALRLLALRGAGVALVGEWAVQDDLRAGALVPLLPAYRVSTSDFDPGIYVVFRQKRNLPLKIRVFIEFLSEAIERQRRDRSSGEPGSEALVGSPGPT